MQTNTPTLPRTIAQLVEQLETQAASRQLSPKAVATIVEQADITGEDLMPFAAFDHPKADCYGRRLLYDGGNFEVMVMSWNPRDYSSIHDHGYTEWGVVQVFDPTHHFIFNERNGELRIAARQILRTGTIIKVNNPLIHQMGNATSEPYLTLHIYGSNTRDQDITADAKSYELEFDRISHTQGGAFFNLPADVIYDFKPAPRRCAETLLHYAHLLMDYYNRQDQTDDIKKLKINLLRKMEQRLVF